DILHRRPSLWWLGGCGGFTMPQRTVAFSIILCLYLAQKTHSDLHVPPVLASPLATHDPSSFEPEVWARLEQRERKTLEDVVGKIEASGGKVEGSHHTTGR